MSANYRLRRFSNPSFLKSISPALLIRFLTIHQEFLAKRGLTLDTGLDCEALAMILMAPDENTPDMLLDALFFVDEMSVPGLHDDLLSSAQEAGIDAKSMDSLTPADLAVRVWLANPNLLQRLHAERFLVKPKSFQSFLSSLALSPSLAKPTVATLKALEVDLDCWFATKKRGRGTRVFAVVNENIAQFVVRHGEPYRREGTLENGESSRVYYRPEKFDIVTYSHQSGELSIHASTKGQKQAYCILFGKHLFGSEQTFEVDAEEGKFTLRPIVDQGRDCLVCTDAEGIEHVALTELQFRHDSAYAHVETHKGEDVFQAMDDVRRKIPFTATLVKASLRVTFSKTLRPRTVVIRPPNIAIFDRESDSETLNDWLTKRGFIQDPRELAHDTENATPALAVY